MPIASEKKLWDTLFYMIQLQLEVLQKDPLTGNVVSTGQKIPIQSNTGTLKLTPAVIAAQNAMLVSKGIYGFHASIDCDKAMIQVEGFKFFSISAYLNREPTIALLHVQGATDHFQLSNLEVRRLDTMESNALLNGCEVEEFNVGMGTSYRNQQEKKDNAAVSPIKTDVRDCRLDQLRIFVPHSMLNVQRTHVDRLVVLRESCKVEQLDLRESTTVERLILSGEISKIKMRVSKVTDLEFHPEARVQEIDMTGSYVYQAHNCRPDTIVSKSADVWRLVMSSAQISNNAALHAKAGYEFMRCERRALRSLFPRIAYRFIELTCGYGYRPLNTVFAALFTCAASGLGFWFLTLEFGDGVRIAGETAKPDQLELLGYTMYYSVITFATVGYGDIVPAGPLARSLAGFEALAGISLTALFVFALTKRYGGAR